MPLLLPEDVNFTLPQMHCVHQNFPRECVEDIKAAILDQMAKEEIHSKITPGASVAVAVGSRGIKNLSVIVKIVLECIQKAGGRPFIISAMGSHGGGTEDGQREVLAGYGISESAMGVEVITKVDTVHLGKTKAGIDIYFDSTAMQADLVVLINRIKLHTDFNAHVQSGLCKMLVIGLGNHLGCTAIHEAGYEAFGTILEEAAEIILKKTPIGFGIAVIENAYDETALIEAIPKEKIIEREKELLEIALVNMPTLMIPEIDVLIVQEIGKNISGAGFDPNILGKSFIRKEFVLPVPRIERMVLFDIAEQSHGNALGMGVFDVITRKVFNKLDFESTYANAIASKSTEDARIPLIAENEEEALRIAIKILQGADRKQLKIVKIKNTLEINTIEVSDALLPYIREHNKLRLQ